MFEFFHAENFFRCEDWATAAACRVDTKESYQKLSELNNLSVQVIKLKIKNMAYTPKRAIPVN